MISVPEAGLLPSTPRAVRVHERVDHVVREAVGIRRQGLRRDDAHHLPVAERRVLAFRALEQATCHRRRTRHRRHALERSDVAEPERLHRGQVEAADSARDVAQGVRPLVSELCCVRQGACAHTVEHDDARARHVSILERCEHRPRPPRRRALHPRDHRDRGQRHLGRREALAGNEGRRGEGQSRRLDEPRAAARPQAARTPSRAPRRRLHTSPCRRGR